MVITNLICLLYDTGVTDDITQCSKRIKIDGQTCSVIDEINGSIEFVYLTIPPLDSDKCYSISMKAGGDFDSIIVGFGRNDSLSHKEVELILSTKVYQSVNGTYSSNGLGDIASTNGMKGSIGSNTLSLNYNPAAGTLYGAYDIERPILLLKNIQRGRRVPLQPFI